mgnify:CR=1 FL=1
MLGVFLVLNREEEESINSSLDYYIQTLKPTEKPIYQMAKRKINEGAVLDGMFMRCIENSLHFESKQTKNENKKLVCKQLAKDIEKKRLEFQYSSIQHLRLG